MALTLDRILAGDCEVPGEEGQPAWHLTNVPLGELGLPTGKVVGRDPFSGPLGPSYARTVAPGRYPVGLRIKVFPGSPFDSALFLVVRLGQAPAVRWELAVAPGEKPRELRAGSELGFKVDSATVGLIDLLVQARLEDERTRDAVQAALEKSRKRGIAAAVVTVDEGRGASVVACGTGGDGVYAAFWGIDASDTPVALVIDLKEQRFERPTALDTGALDARARAVAAELAAGDPLVQRKAVNEVASLGWERARPLLPVVESVLAHSTDREVRGAAARVLAGLAGANPALREEYRGVLETGQPAPRLRAILDVATQISWKADEAIGEALLRLLASAEDVPTLVTLFGTIVRLSHWMPPGEGGRRLAPFLAHPEPFVRAGALRALAMDFSARQNKDVGGATAAERSLLAQQAEAAARDAELQVRLAAVRALHTAVRFVPAEHARLLLLLDDQTPDVTLEAVEQILVMWRDLAEELRLSVVNRLRQLAFDEALPAAARKRALEGLGKSAVADSVLLSDLEELAGAGGPLAMPAGKAVDDLRRALLRKPAGLSPPPPPGARPLFESQGVRLDRLPAGRVCLRGPAGVLFDLEERRIFEVEARPDGAGGALLRLNGALQPHRLDRITPEGALYGPFPAADTDKLAGVMARMFELPVLPRRVDFAELARSPRAFHGLVIESEGEWSRGLERSDFAGAWLTPPVGWTAPAGGSVRVRVTGLWHGWRKPGGIQLGPFPGGFGHLGLYRAELEAWRLVILG
jgi:hypothetical protein